MPKGAGCDFRQGGHLCGLPGLGGVVGGSKFTANGARFNFALAPLLDAESQAQRRVALAVLDFAEPTFTGPAEAKGHGALLKREAEGCTMLSERHAAYSPEVNTPSSADIHFTRTDVTGRFSDNLNMAAPDKPLWYLQEWFATQDKIQRTLITELGWLPGKAYKVWHGIQEPKPSEMHDIAAFLNIRPHELMMHPEDAMRIRRLEAAVREVAAADAPLAAEPATNKKISGKAA